MDLLTGLFGRVDLLNNTTKTELITFIPGKIRISLLDMAYRERMNKNFRGKGKGQKVECGRCGTFLAVGSMAGNITKQHDIYQSFVLEEDPNGSLPPLPWRWEAPFYPTEGCYRCPVTGCPQECDGSGMQDA